MRYVRYTDEAMEKGVGMSFVGKVWRRSERGIFIKLENGEIAYAEGYTKLPQGAPVRCFGEKPATRELRMLVQIENVINYEGRRDCYA